jgi:hypothetical protein
MGCCARVDTPGATTGETSSIARRRMTYHARNGERTTA